MTVSSCYPAFLSLPCRTHAPAGPTVYTYSTYLVHSPRSHFCSYCSPSPSLGREEEGKAFFSDFRRASCWLSAGHGLQAWGACMGVLSQEPHSLIQISQLCCSHINSILHHCIHSNISALRNTSISNVGRLQLWIWIVVWIWGCGFSIWINILGPPFSWAVYDPLHGNQLPLNMHPNGFLEKTGCYLLSGTYKKSL